MGGGQGPQVPGPPPAKILSAYFLSGAKEISRIKFNDFSTSADLDINRQLILERWVLVRLVELDQDPRKG